MIFQLQNVVIYNVHVCMKGFEYLIEQRPNRLATGLKNTATMETTMLDKKASMP